MHNNPETNSNFTLTFSTRQQALRAHLAVYGPKYTELAKKLDIAIRTATDLCQRETASPHRVEQMKELGIPEELLPLPMHPKPGPKSFPKSQESEAPGYDA